MKIYRWNPKTGSVSLADSTGIVEITDSLTAWPHQGTTMIADPDGDREWGLIIAPSLASARSAAYDHQTGGVA